MQISHIIPNLKIKISRKTSANATSSRFSEFDKDRLFFRKGISQSFLLGVLGILSCSLIGCQSFYQQQPDFSSTQTTNNSTNDSTTILHSHDSHNKQTHHVLSDYILGDYVLGDYVTDSYFERDKGYDWYVVRVNSATDDESIRVSVRSRIDIKKPTCTFDTIAHKIKDNHYQFLVFEHPIDMIFNHDTLTIDGKLDNLWKTGFYCSGGANLAGDYQKLKGKLDTQHLDKF